MSKEEFEQWALAVVMQVEQGREQADQFIAQVEEHDKEAAALLRQRQEATVGLSDHLKQRFAR